MLVSDVIAATANDVRQVIASTASSIYIPWVDRIVKDALHTSLWNNLLQQTQTINVLVATPSYTLTLVGGVAIRRINMVYDRTFDRLILPVDNIDFPMSKGDSEANQSPNTNPMPLLSATTMVQWPEYYKRINETTIVFFPAPQKTVFEGTYEVYYEMAAPDLVNTTDTILIPDDGIDLVVAGVNAYACQYLHLDTEAGYWKQEYESMKKGTMLQ